MTASVKAIEAVRHECTKGWDETPTAGRHPYTELMVEFEVKDPGPAHVCGIHYTTDMWKTREVAYAECVLLDGPNGPGGVEKWAAHVNLKFQADLLEFAVFCYDYRDGDHVREIFDNNHGELYRATPLERAEARRPSEPKYARASAPEIRPSTLTGHGAAIRVMPEPRVQPKPPAAAATGRAIPAATLVSLDAVAPYLEILMMRNFATNTWKFTVNGKVSLPGCIIASPSEPGDAETDQSYANSWVRDSALCALEAGRIDLPWSKIDLLDDFVSFSRLTQQQARNANRQGHACFFVDGTLRPWGIQADGPALRTIAVLDFFDQLSGSGRDEAKRLINDDVSYLLSASTGPTINLWEETSGFHYFTRAVQKRCFELVAPRRDELGLTASAADLTAAAERLGGQLEEHWVPEHRHYRETLGGSGRGINVNAATIMGAVYGALQPANPRLLSSAGVVWDSFRMLYNINNYDVNVQGVGPMIGRYPEDEYDGDMQQQPNVGHPWPLCTALFAQFYYLLARQLRADGKVVVEDLSRRFFEQIGFAPGFGTYPAGFPEFEAVLCKLRAAGDRMLAAVLFHSDHLEFSEQYHRDNGYETSVRNLTWSYATYLSALRARREIPV